MNEKLAKMDPVVDRLGVFNRVYIICLVASKASEK